MTHASRLHASRFTFHPTMWLFRDKPEWKNPVYNLREEIGASITHGIGAVLGVIGLGVLIYLASARGESWHLIGFVIYGVSLIALFLASTLYHSVQKPGPKRTLRTIDHAAIYVFIAGSYTPFLLTGMRGTKGWIILLVVWTMALAGILWKIFFLGRLEILATIFYIIMGWMALLALDEILAAVPPIGVAFIVAGGVLYTVGILFYAWDRIPYNHIIWHLFVLVASVSHFLAVTTLVT